MRTIFTRGLAALAVVLSLFTLAPPAAAQTALTSTTLAAAVTDTSGKVFSLTSATGVTASTVSAQTWLLVDKELVQIQSLSSTYATVIRGWGSTLSATHGSGATVYYIPAVTALTRLVPYGSCTRTNLPYVPLIVTGANDIANNGITLDCLGSLWTPTNATLWPVYGSTVASATTIGATGTYFKVSGTTSIATITVPAGWANGMCLNLEPTGLWSTTNAGNIAIATTGVVSKVLTECWNGTKWSPSY